MPHIDHLDEVKTGKERKHHGSNSAINVFVGEKKKELGEVEDNSHQW